MCLWFGYNPQIIFCHMFRILNLVNFQARTLSNCIDSGYSSYSFMPIFWKLYRCFSQGHSLTMVQGHLDSAFSDFFFLETAWPTEARFYVELPWDAITKV